MTGQPATGFRSRPALSPWRFIVAFGVVAMLADAVYEGVRSVAGPFLASLGATAAVVGLVTGAGEAAALVLRLVTGPAVDRLGRPWRWTIIGYALTVLSVPLLALTGSLWGASALLITERTGKAVRSPAKDSLLAGASAGLGRGRAFAVHEALDQVGAFAGPLLIAGALTVSGGYRLGFALLAVPAVAVLGLLGWLARRVPDPGHYERPAAHQPGRLPARFYWYAAFTALTMAGFATFGLLGYHLVVRHLVAPALVPVVYAVVMGVDALAALGTGWLYDRIGLRVLLVLPVLVGLVPVLGFAGTATAAVTGAVVWGAAMGVQESTMRAAVADLVPAGRRGTGYGVFGAVYGLAWLVGGAMIGVLYDRSTTVTVITVIALQVAALAVLFGVLWRRGGTRVPAPRGPADRPGPADASDPAGPADAPGPARPG